MGGVVQSAELALAVLGGVLNDVCGVQEAAEQKRHQRQANRLIVISPMIDARARKVAERLGIEIYGDSTEVEAL